MAGSATLGTNLVDSLQPTIDSLRSELYAAFGVNQYRVFVVTRAWSGGEMGVGVVTSTEIELDPVSVSFASEYDKEPCGIDELGTIRLTEISLTYTEAEVLGPPAAASSEFFYRLEDGQGQEIQTTYWQPVRTKKTDRSQNMGWSITLSKMATPEGL